MKKNIESNKLHAVASISEKLGYEWNKSGRDCYVGSSLSKIDGDDVLAVQVWNGVENKYRVSQEIRDDGVVIKEYSPKNAQHIIDYHVNSYLHDAVIDGFIPSDIMIEEPKQFYVKQGNGRAVIEKMISKKVDGYMHGRYKIVDVGENSSGNMVFKFAPL